MRMFFENKTILYNIGIGVTLMRNVSAFNPANYGLGSYSRNGRTNRNGLGLYTGFGKGVVAPPPQAPGADPAMLMMLQMMMEELRQLRQYQSSTSKDQQIATLEAKVNQIASQAPADAQAQAIVSEIKEEITKQVTPVREQQREMEAKKIFTSGASEAEVAGSGGKNVRELLTSAGQAKFTRSSVSPDANLEVTHFQRLMQDVPPGFDEAKYLAKHPDVADAVRKGVMPSGLWHYVRYGKQEGRALAGWDIGGLLSNKMLLAGAAAAAAYYFFYFKK